MHNGLTRVRVVREFLPGWVGQVIPENFREGLRYSDDVSLDPVEFDLFLAGAHRVHLVRDLGIAVFRRYEATATSMLREVKLTNPMCQPKQSRPVVIYDYEFVEWRPLPEVSVGQEEIPAL